MNIKNLLISISVVFIIQGCLPTSKMYRPSNSERPHFYNANKSIFPSDVRKDFNAYKGAKIHWIGIIRERDFINHDGEVFLKLKIEQKYWDYIEDFSIQTEKIFLSPLGEGDFYFVIRIDPRDKENYSKFAVPPNLAIIYGTVEEVKDGDITILGDYVKFIDEQYYATNIFSYRVARDSSGKVVLGKDGFPKLVDFKMLKIPKAGRNQKKEEK
jgi:hypothetical protein